MKTMGRDLAAAAMFEEMLQRAGSEDINVRTQDFPASPWAKGGEEQNIGPALR